MSDIPPWDRRDPNNPAHPAHSEYLISTNGYVAERVDEFIEQSCKSDLLSICQSHKLERCGFITSDWEIVAVENVHEVPEFNFYMDTEDAQQSLEYIINETQREVLGVWHTHPNNWPWPSPRDICGWPDLGVVDWRYFIVTNNEVIEWRKVKADGK